MNRDNPENWIWTMTGKRLRYWTRRVGVLIGKHAYWDKKVSKTHQCVKISAWMKDLTAELEKSIEDRLDKKRDENMAFASVLAIIFVRWFTQLVRAKSYDPRRPVKIRKMMMERRTAFCALIARCLLDESTDHLDYPDQEWDSPFLPGAKNGKYV